tara:strand:+ start:326 stop:547 length:222 start_codon:yes stop_codon:yes gene_type:complete
MPIQDLTTDQWAIMICLDGKDDWIFITENTNQCDWNLKPLLFNDINDALLFADKYVVIGKEENVKVINYISPD